MGLRALAAPLALAGVCAAACTPDTDLVGEGSPEDGTDGTDGTAGTATGASLIDPTPGAASVPVNLAAIVLRLPGIAPATELAVPDQAVSISGGAGVVPALPALVVDCPVPGPGTCLRIALAERLLPATTYLVALRAGIFDGAGSAVGAGAVGQFVTGREPDETPPGIAGFAVTPSGPCVLVTFQTDETAAGFLVLGQNGMENGMERVVPAGAGGTTFSVAASVASIAGGSEVHLRGRAVDLAGNVAETAAASLVVPPGLLPVAITEIRANPAGPEPTQEYVELRNLGAAPVELQGLTIEDTKGGEALPAAIVAPGAYVLVVPSGFDASGAVDTPPLPGTPLLRIDARLGFDGLANGGEAVRLRDQAGTVLTSYGVAIDVSGSRWSGKAVHRVPEDACDQAASWTRSPLEATPGWGAPDPF